MAKGIRTQPTSPNSIPTSRGWIFQKKMLSDGGDRLSAAAGSPFFLKSSRQGCDSPNRFICRGSHGLVSRGLEAWGGTLTAASEHFQHKYQWIRDGPSKTHRKINILIELLHFSWERHLVFDSKFPGASWPHPRCLQMLLRCLQDVSQMPPPWCLLNASLKS